MWQDREWIPLLFILRTACYIYSTQNVAYYDANSCVVQMYMHVFIFRLCERIYIVSLLNVGHSDHIFAACAL
jgi:hypothetical protein